jgi:hypothetical protein
MGTAIARSVNMRLAAALHNYATEMDAVGTALTLDPPYL